MRWEMTGACAGLLTAATHCPNRGVSLVEPHCAPQPERPKHLG